MNFRNFSVVVILIFLFGCNQKDTWDCIQTTGKSVEVRRIYDDIHVLKISGDIDVEVIPNQSQFELNFIGGQNLIDDIKIEENGNELRLTNTNTCGILRDQSKPLKVQIYCDTLSKLTANIVGNLKFTDTMYVRRFEYIIDNALGEHSLFLNAKYVSLTLHAGINHIYLSGEAREGFIYANASNSVFAQGMLFDQKLELNKVNDTPAHAYCPGEVFLITENAGPVYLYSEPDTIYRWGDNSAQIYYR